MVRKVKVKSLSEGDWLYKDMNIGNVKLKANWDGLTKKDIQKLKKHYKLVKIKQGIPFVPVFLICYLMLLFVIGYDLLNIIF
jgi:prepilin signal peptidase PulO-like enzyme (type II secretory pathway)